MPNDPYLDNSVRWKIATGNARLHEARYDEEADAILDSGLAVEVVRPIGSGKEAEVLLCRDGGRPLAVKIYRFYRTSHRGGRAIKMDSMGHLASREFELLGYAHAGGAPVPAPGRRVEHMFSMQFLGAGEEPAPRLQDARLEDPERTRDAILAGIDLLAEAGVVHTDLSPFNILVLDDEPRFIDFARALRVDRLGASPWMRLTEASEALRRSTEALEGYFRRYHVPFEGTVLRRSILERMDRFGVFG